MEMMARTAKSFAASWSRPDALRQKPDAETQAM